MTRRGWTKEELKTVLSLYYQIPFGQMHTKNLAVIELSRSIARTPSAVALKLVNFASMDPELQARGVRGMRNASVLDRTVWQEFREKWDLLADTFVSLQALRKSSTTKRANDSKRRSLDGPTETQAFAKQRRGQRFFRNSVLASFDWKCCITGIASVELLRASHIIPWASSEKHRLDPRNGLCLNALHDAAFDRGLIGLTEDYRLVVSKKIARSVPPRLFETAFKQHEGQVIRLPERYPPDPSYLSYHMREIFVG